MVQTIAVLVFCRGDQGLATNPPLLYNPRERQSHSPANDALQCATKPAHLHLVGNPESHDPDSRAQAFNHSASFRSNF